MKKMLGIILGLVFIFCACSCPTVLAADFNDDACSVADDIQKDALGCGETREATSVFQNIMNAAVATTGIVAVFMIVMGGQRYITSNGDPNKMATAKNTIIWGVVGLVVAALAGAIVNFVLKSVTS